MPARGVKQRGLTRQAVVLHALEIGDAEGLDAVSLRRLATDLRVTPMALYRHIKDKRDLINAMTEVVLEGLDLTVGLQPAMPWTARLRQAFTNFRDQMQARPLALPLAIAYTGEGPASFWRMNEVLLGILLDAGFKRRDAVVFIRILSNLVSGYLLLMRQGRVESMEALDTQGLDIMRRRVELTLLSLPRDRFPHSNESAGEIAEVWMSDPDQWWSDTVDLIIFGLEKMLERRTAGRADRRTRRT